MLVDRGEVSIYSAAERATKAFELIRRYPDLPFIFLAVSLGVSPLRGCLRQTLLNSWLQSRVCRIKTPIMKIQSRNTYENIVLMKPMMLALGAKGANQVDEADKLEKPWLLITSASHMYRSLKIFQKQGIEVIPVPVDYQTGNQLRWDKFDPRGWRTKLE